MSKPSGSLNAVAPLKFGKFLRISALDEMPQFINVFLGNMSVDWFQAESSLTYTLGSDDGYDQVVVYYTCFLASVVESGMGIERIRLADVEVYYDTKQFRYFIDLALEMLRFKLGVSIKKTTYNADPHLGTVNWNKNIDGEDSTKNIRQRPRGVNYGD